jgi:hypothetical protein
MLVRVETDGGLVKTTAFGGAGRAGRTIRTTPQLGADVRELLSDFLAGRVGCGDDPRLLCLEDAEPVISSRIPIRSVLGNGSNCSLREAEEVSDADHPSATRIARVIVHVDGEAVRAAAPPK